MKPFAKHSAKWMKARMNGVQSIQLMKPNLGNKLGAQFIKACRTFNWARRAPFYGVQGFSLPQKL